MILPIPFVLKFQQYRVCGIYPLEYDLTVTMLVSSSEAGSLKLVLKTLASTTQNQLRYQHRQRQTRSEAGLTVMMLVSSVEARLSKQVKG